MSLFNLESIHLYQRGIFPGPLESDTDFQNRCAKQRCVPSLHSSALLLVKQLFDAAPDWIEIKTSSKGLLVWEGAALWIEEDSEGSRFCFIQIKDSILTRLYPQEEVVAHEMVHAMRLMFDEERFEEILAYCTSKNRFRRYFGPLFSRPLEARGFMLLMLLSWIFYGAEMFLDFSMGGFYFLFSPLLLLGWGLFRLVRSQSVFTSALNHLKAAISPHSRSLAVALHLTDQEIELFAKSSPREIVTYARLKSQVYFRWRQIFYASF